MRITNLQAYISDLPRFWSFLLLQALILLLLPALGIVIIKFTPLQIYFLAHNVKYVALEFQFSCIMLEG